MVLALVGVVAMIAALSLPRPASGCDDGAHTLHRERVMGASVVALSQVVLAALEPGTGVPATGVIAAILGTAIGRVLPRTRPRATHQEPLPTSTSAETTGTCRRPRRSIFLNTSDSLLSRSALTTRARGVMTYVETKQVGLVVHGANCGAAPRTPSSPLPGMRNAADAAPTAAP